jgi:hypothetical protein
MFDERNGLAGTMYVVNVVPLIKFSVRTKGLQYFVMYCLQHDDHCKSS